MSIADYAHWNEDAEYMWWHEEGKHGSEEPYHADTDHYDDFYEGVPHDDADGCIASGDFSTKDGVLWRCDVCDDSAVFVKDEDGFELRIEATT